MKKSNLLFWGKKPLKVLTSALLAGFYLVLLFCNPAFSRPIISGISTNQINIDTNFTGAEVLLFGAKGDAGNIIINVRGPKENYLVSKKDKFLGIWYKKELAKFRDSYSYYSFLSSKENVHLDPKILSLLEIGETNIQFEIRGIKKEHNQEFIDQFISKLSKRNLYLNQPNSVGFLDETLFKVMLKFPKNIAVGVYTVEIYLLDESQVVAFQAIPINVHQVGFSADINKFAYQNSVLYGIVAIFIAVLAGFLANLFFKKFFS